MTLSSNETLEWLEVFICTHPIAHDPLSAFLFDLGCSGITYEDCNGPVLKVYFPSNKNPADIRRRIIIFLQELQAIFPELQSHELSVRKLKDQDWKRTWQKFFHPDRITPKLMVYPAWETPPCSTHGHIIRIDPGPAFGTGQHPTTRMCLEALENILAAGQQCLLDVGTGSGILAIYGAKLGAKSVTAIDSDLQALRWADHNIKLNKLAARIALSSEPLEVLKDRFSVITANLILEEIIRLIPFFASLLFPEGVLILSGILKSQIKEVTNALGRHAFHDCHILSQEDWCCIVAKRLVSGSRQVA